MTKRKLCLILTIIVALLSASTCFATWQLDGVGPKPITDIAPDITKILGYAQWIGFVVAVVMCIWVGIKYITAGAGDKAKVKDTLVPMLIGAALVALAPTVAAGVFSMFDDGQAESVPPQRYPSSFSPAIMD